jgi:hypothetical protein
MLSSVATDKALIRFFLFPSLFVSLLQRDGAVAREHGHASHVNIVAPEAQGGLQYARGRDDPLRRG